MAHEIMENDKVLLSNEQAWHGLGIVFEGEKTALEAQKEVLDWNVLQAPVAGMLDDGDEL